MTDPTEIARVAAGLTRAQRRAVETLTVPDGRGKWPTRNSLERLGMLTPFPFYDFTPEARAVRDHILREKSGG
jgi:hypothetical protein